jgi:preprotein translocase subunit SecE
MNKRLEKILKNKATMYFVEAYGELKKVTWPTQEIVVRYTAFVLGFSAVCAVYFGLLDWGSTLGVENLFKLFK